MSYHNADYTQSMTLTSPSPPCRGRGGIWCVERWQDPTTTAAAIRSCPPPTYPWRSTTPTSRSRPAGSTPSKEGQADLLTPEGAALDWLRQEYAGVTSPPTASGCWRARPPATCGGRLSRVLAQEGTLESFTWAGEARPDCGPIRADYYGMRTAVVLPMGRGGDLAVSLRLGGCQPRPPDRAAVRYRRERGRRPLSGRGRLVRWTWTGGGAVHARPMTPEHPYDRMYDICQKWAEYAPFCRTSPATPARRRHGAATGLEEGRPKVDSSKPEAGRSASGLFHTVHSPQEQRLFQLFICFAAENVHAVPSHIHTHHCRALARHCRSRRRWRRRPMVSMPVWDSMSLSKPRPGAAAIVMPMPLVECRPTAQGRALSTPWMAPGCGGDLLEGLDHLGGGDGEHPGQAGHEAATPSSRSAPRAEGNGRSAS